MCFGVYSEGSIVLDETQVASGPTFWRRRRHTLCYIWLVWCDVIGLRSWRGDAYLVPGSGDGSDRLLPGDVYLVTRVDYTWPSHTADTEYGPALKCRRLLRGSAVLSVWRPLED